MDKISKGISILFHPLLLPSYAFAYIIFTNPYLFAVYEGTEWVFLVRVILNTFLFPAACIFLLWRLGFMKSIEMKEKEDRIIPYITTGTLYVWAYVTFRKSSDPQILNIILLGSCIALFLCFFANIFTKVSIHAAGAACLCIVVMQNILMSSYDTKWVFLLIIFIAGMIGVSRIKLKSHSIQEVFGGYLIGIAAQLFAYRFL